MEKHQIEKGLNELEASPKTVMKNLEILKQKEADVLDEIRTLRKRISENCSDSSMEWELISSLKSLKALEKQELKFQSRRGLKCSRLQVEVEELDKMLKSGTNNDSVSDSFIRSFQDSNEKLDSRKKELAAKLRSIVSLKRLVDAVPSQPELIQYELRFSELNNHIQKKLRQTRTYYDTYNALMEIKELMAKETSLLNSISLQFQDAMNSADRRAKLIHSMEGISEGIQQKLEKAQVTLQSDEKFRDSLKEKYTAAVTEQRRNSSLLKLFQEECARNEKLRSQIT